MVFVRVMVGVVCGAGLAAHYRTTHSLPRSTSSFPSCPAVLAISAPTLADVMDTTKDITPVRAVIIGGGYAGSKLAAQLDSVFDTTFIDEKNFFELSDDVIPIICNPWDEEKSREACRRMMVLHRYYLKHTNVLTGTVDGVDSELVYLRDGRTVPYDVLFVTTGEQKSFPFATRQRTLAGRVQELRHFNTFLQKCTKVAIVGGGPTGTALAADLARLHPRMQVHLFHYRPELLPTMPRLCRQHAHEVLATNKNLHLHLSTRVTDIDARDSQGNAVHCVEQVSESEGIASSRKAWRRVWPFSQSSRETRPSISVADKDSSAKSSIAHAALTRTDAVPVTYRVTYDVLPYKAARPQSILSQLYFGKQDELDNNGSVNVHGTAPQEEESSQRVSETHSEDGFDYVFAVAGNVPRPITAGPGRPNVLASHEMPDGHYRVSTLMQLFAQPHIFAVGRCNNLPVVRCYGSSDMEVRTLFRALNSIITRTTPPRLQSSDGVHLNRMKLPRIGVRLGLKDAVSCTPWSGGMTGLSALHEFMQDRNYLTRELLKPVFFKQQDPLKVRERINAWKATDITDITDFSHS